MMAWGHSKALSGFIALDDAFLGGERTGCKLRSLGQPTRTKHPVVNGFHSTEMSAWCRQHLTANSTVTSDGRVCFNTLTDADGDGEYDRIVCGGDRASVEELESAQ